MEVIVGLIAIVFGVLQIILFFKVWKMTNDTAWLTEFTFENQKEIKSTLSELLTVQQQQLKLLAEYLETQEPNHSTSRPHTTRVESKVSQIKNMNSQNGDEQSENGSSIQIPQEIANNMSSNISLFGFNKGDKVKSKADGAIGEIIGFTNDSKFVCLFDNKFDVLTGFQVAHV